MEAKVKVRLKQILGALVWIATRETHGSVAEKVLIAASWIHLSLGNDGSGDRYEVSGMIKDVDFKLSNYAYELGAIDVDPMSRPYTEQAMINLQEAIFLLRK